MRKEEERRGGGGWARCASVRAFPESPWRSSLRQNPTVRRRSEEEGEGGAMRVGRDISGIFVGIFLVREEDSQGKGRGPSHRVQPAAFFLA